MKIEGQIIAGNERSNIRVPGPLHILALLVRREIGGRLTSVWMWAVASIACLIAAVFGAGFVRSFETETVLVSADPLQPLNASILAFLATVLGLRLSTSLSWEREHRTLEVLMVAPVGQGALVLAKFLAELVVLGGLLLVYAVYLMIGQPLGFGTLGLGDLMGLMVAVPFALPMIAFGLLVSSAFNSVRASVVTFLTCAVLLASAQILTSWLGAQAPQDLSLPLLYVRSGLQAADVVLKVVSPLSYLSDLFSSAAGVAFLSATRCALALGVSLAFLALAVGVTRQKGAM